MPSAEALAAALGMWRNPRLVGNACQMPLPRGMTFLLKVAVGDVDALNRAAMLTDHPGPRLQEAAGFFIEQVLFSQNADHYRTLGARKDASYSELRRHMALLMRWVHPDLFSGGGASPCLDRSVYAKRVTKAWEAVKTGAPREISADRLPQGGGGESLSQHPVISILLRMDGIQDEADPDGKAPGAHS